MAALTTTWKTLKVTEPSPAVYHVELHRPEKLNAMNSDFWREMRECMVMISRDTGCRAVIISGAGRVFTAGLDLFESGMATMGGSTKDMGRKAYHMRQHVLELQDSFTAIEKCPQPVIAAVHSACVGGGIDLITACDIRYCSDDAWFTVKEVDVGLAADVGTLQRLPKVIGNSSLVRELAFTARKMKSAEALSCGLVSKVCTGKDATFQAALETAKTIAKLSPLAIAGTKINLNFSRDHNVTDGLNFVATWNMAMLQSPDVIESAKAIAMKKPATFSKL